MTQEHYYDITVRWDNNRKGTVSSRALPTTIEVATPPEFPKGIEGIWSPEHFFVAAVNSCLMTTFLAIAENSRLEFSGFSCQAVGKLEMVEGKYMISEITLQPTVTIPKADDTERAERILRKAEAACLISNSIKSRIIFEPKIEVI